VVLDKQILSGVEEGISSEVLKKAKEMTQAVFDEMRRDFTIRADKKPQTSR